MAKERLQTAVLHRTRGEAEAEADIPEAFRAVPLDISPAAGPATPSQKKGGKKSTTSRSVHTMYHALNKNTVDKVAAFLENQKNKPLNSVSFSNFSFHEKVALRMALVPGNNPEGKYGLADDMVKKLRADLDRNLVYSVKMPKVKDKMTVMKARQAALPASYERDTRAKVETLAQKMRTDKTLQADAAKWSRLSPDAKRNMLSRWLNIMVKELKIDQMAREIQRSSYLNQQEKALFKTSYTIVDGRTNAQFSTVPHLQQCESEKTRCILAPGEYIFISKAGKENLNNQTLHESLEIVLHEVMHIHDMLYATKIMNSQNATDDEREYAMRLACAAATTPASSEEGRNTHIAESSALYFQTIYKEKVGVKSTAPSANMPQFKWPNK